MFVIKNKKFLFIVFFIISIALMSFSDEMQLSSIDSILVEIRKEQGLNVNAKINPDKVSEKNLEELGDSVMEAMIGNHAEHERMDQMMGGDGSPALKAMHSSLAYRYLSGVPIEWMGYGGMMNGNNRGGIPMMSNNGFGMMNWGWGGWIIGIIVFVIILIGIGLIIFFILKNYKGHHTGTSYDAPIDILKKRYANGEITKDEFEKMKKDL